MFLSMQDTLFRLFAAGFTVFQMLLKICKALMLALYHLCDEALL